MRTQRLRRSGCLAVEAAALWLACGSLAAQSPAASTKTYAPPRLADGHPDLQGTYDAATMTPVERPAEYGNRLTLTPEEAAKMERQQQERTEAGSEPSQADRALPPAAATVRRQTPISKACSEPEVAWSAATIFSGFLPAANSRPSTAETTSIVVDPVNGRVPPMKPEARARNAAALATRVSPDAAEGAAAGPAGAFDNPEARPLAERCLLGFSSTDGPPALPNYWYNNLKQIVQTRDSVMILNEMVHDARIIRMGGAHLPSTIRKWMGDSVGHWEGDTLVVEPRTSRTRRSSAAQAKICTSSSASRAPTITPSCTGSRSTIRARGSPLVREYPWVATNDNIYEYRVPRGELLTRRHPSRRPRRGRRSRDREESRTGQGQSCDSGGERGDRDVASTGAQGKPLPRQQREWASSVFRTGRSRPLRRAKRSCRSPTSPRTSTRRSPRMPTRAARWICGRLPDPSRQRISSSRRSTSATRRSTWRRIT